MVILILKEKSTHKIERLRQCFTMTEGRQGRGGGGAGQRVWGLHIPSETEGIPVAQCHAATTVTLGYL